MFYIGDVDDARRLYPEVTLRELRNFVVLAASQSITAAASTIGLSQPAMSTSMANLERSMGVSLFVRHRGRGISLTPQGELLAHEARQLLVHADEVHLRIAGSQSVESGQVSVGSLVTVAPIVLPRLVRLFGETRPGVAVNIRTGAQDQLLEWLRRGEIHVAITYDIALARSFEFQHLMDALPRVLVPASHPFASRPSLRLDEMSDDRYILLDLALSREYFTSLFLAAHLPYRPALFIDDLSLVRSLVANGFGYSLVNLHPTSNLALDGGQVAYVRLETPVQPLRLGVTWLAESKQPLVVRSFVQFAVDTVATPDRLTEGSLVDSSAPPP